MFVARDQSKAHQPRVHEAAGKRSMNAANDATIEVDFDLTFDDLVALHRWSSRGDPLVGRLILVRMLAMALIVVLCFGFWGYVRQIPFPPEPIYFVPFSIVLVVALATVPWLVRRSQIRHLKRSCSKGEAGKLIGAWRVIVKPSALTLEGAGTTSTIAWSEYTNVVLTDEFVLLHLGGSPADMIPRRAFRSYDELVDFVEIVRRYISTDNRKNC
jgi:hypothetical protein